MKSKKIVNILTIILAINIIFALPVYASDGEELNQPLGFEVYEASMGQGKALYCRLPSVENLSDLGNLTSVIPYFSLDGETYEPSPRYDSFDWITLGGDKTFRICATPYDEPYKSYLRGEISSFYVKLCIKGITATGEPFQYFSEAAKLEQILGVVKPVTLPEDYTIYPLRYLGNMRMGWPAVGKYNITVKKNATTSDILALLPERINLESQIEPPGGNAMIVEPVNCKISWSDSLNEINTSQVDSVIKIISPSCVTSPEEAFATIDNKLYSYKPEALRMNLRLIVNVVDDQPTDLELSGESDGLSVSLIKPSGATAYCPEYSLDGGITWIAGSEVALNDSIINYIPNSETLSLLAFSPKETPMKEYIADNAKGFYMRIHFTGGTLDGYTDSAVWPGEYKYVPSSGSDDNGSGGNRGDSGNDNSGTGGIRDDRPIIPQVPQEQLPEEILPPEVLPQEPLTQEPLLSTTKPSELLGITSNKTDEKVTEKEKEPKSQDDKAPKAFTSKVVKTQSIPKKETTIMEDTTSKTITLLAIGGITLILATASVAVIRRK